MIFIFVLIVSFLLIFVGFYIISFSFLGGEFNNLYPDIFQSENIVSQNFKLVKNYKSHYLNNGNGYNDLTGNKVDDNQNDDNHYCYKNFGNFEDKDCFYRSLYGFIPPNTELNLGYFEKVNGSGLKLYFSGSLNKDIIVKLNYINSGKSKGYKFYKTGSIDKSIKDNNISIKLKNKNNSWINYFIRLKNSEGLKNFNNGSIYDKKLSQNHNYFLNNKKIINNDLILNTGYNKRPINPFSGSLITGDFDDGGSTCATTGKNDIAFSWNRTGNTNLSGDMYFEIKTGANKNLTGKTITGLNLTGVCDNNFKCTWTGKNYGNGLYYFKSNTYRCLDSSCNKTLKNIGGSYIYSGKIDTCN